MNPLRPGSLPGEGGVQRVAVAGLGARGALDQPDGLAAGHVDGGQQRQGAGFRACHRISSSQFASTAPPASADFSGWNWVAHSGPSSTAAMKSCP